MYQTFELDPSESAKPVTLGSSQVAFAPGAPGADPWALAGGAAAEASPPSRAIHQAARVGSGIASREGSPSAEPTA